MVLLILFAQILLLFFFFFLRAKIRLYVSFELSMTKGATENPLCNLKNCKQIILTLIQSPTTQLYHYTTNDGCSRLDASQGQDTWQMCAFIFPQDKRGELSAHIRPGQKQYPIHALETPRIFNQ